jgi:hypothetical protein
MMILRGGADWKIATWNVNSIRVPQEHLGGTSKNSGKMGAAAGFLGFLPIPGLHFSLNRL